MRVLFVTSHTYLPERVGGSESSIHDLCLALRARGIEVAVLARTLARPRGARGRLRSLLPRRSLRVDRRMGYRAFRGPEPEKSVAEVVRRFRPSVAVVHAGRPMEMARELLHAGLPTCVYLRDVQFNVFGGPLEARPGLCYLANSRFTAERFREACGLAATVISPLVLAERYRTRGPGDRVVFVNPDERKGWGVALQLARSRPDVAFEFVESWPLTPEVRARRQRELLGASHVSWREPVLDMRVVYRRARLLLVPSLASRGVWEESWGRVVTEAHCSGIPVLASRSGGLPEAVGPGGVLVEPDAEPVAWEKALSRIWDDPREHEALSRAAREWAARPEIQPDSLLPRFLAALRTVASSGSP